MGGTLYSGVCFSFFVATVEIGEEFCIRVCFSFFFLFSMQNQIPQIIIGLG